MPIQLFNRLTNEGPITLRELFALLSAEQLDRQAQPIREMREAFACPATVKDGDYDVQLTRFYHHYQNRIWKANFNLTPPFAYASIDVAMRWWDLMHNSKGNLRAREREAISGHDGGFMRIVDDLTDGMINHWVDTYITHTLFEYLPSDYDRRNYLAQELLSTYGTLLFPNEKIFPYQHVTIYLDTILKNFAKNLFKMNQQWRQQ